MRLARRPKQRECYYCLTADAQDTPGADPRARPANWRCSECGCWNVYDGRGVIMGDLPAMRDSTLNGASFAKRGRPSSARLPTPSSTRSSPFCRDCVTNQTLVMNLLSNYLPDESDPSYQGLSDDLPRYIASLHERYPPVCAACQPSVDDALKRSDQRAQAEAWGRALRRGAMKPDKPGRSLGVVEVGMWRVRGVLWVLDAAMSWGIGLAAWLAPDDLATVASSRTIGLRATTYVLVFRVFAILWAVWDPTWLRRTRSQAALEGRSAWVAAMLALCCLRTGTAIFLSSWSRNGAVKAPSLLVKCAASDFIATIAALYQLRVSQPVALTLVRPIHASPSATPAPAAAQSPASLSSLSLNPAPIQPPPAASNHVFGQQSMVQPVQNRDESEPMDWEPSLAPGSMSAAEGDDWDSFGVGRQRMFPPQTGNDETGLESLLAGWGISAGAVGGTAPTSNGPSGIPMGSLPSAPLAPRGLVLDDAKLRLARKVLLGARLLALVAAVGSVTIGIRIHDFAAPALATLLGLEAAASALALAVVLASRRPGSVPLAAIVLASDAVVRAAALVSPSVPTSLPHEALAAAGAEIACAAWAALDAFVLVST